MPVGLVVLLGCEHRGIVNILAAEASAFPGKPLAAPIGGFHLVDAPWEAMAATAKDIAEYAPGLVACSHCTGPRGFSPSMALCPEGQAGLPAAWLSKYKGQTLTRRQEGQYGPPHQ